MGAPGGEDVEEVGKLSVGRGPIFTKVPRLMMAAVGLKVEL